MLRAAHGQEGTSLLASRSEARVLRQNRNEAVNASATQVVDSGAVARGWTPGYFKNVFGSLPDFPAVDDDSGSIDPTLDWGEDELRFDLPDQPDTSS